jgi:Holliday junction resolvase-like predicted endonuclease
MATRWRGKTGRMTDSVRRDAEKRGRRGEWAASLLLQLKGYRILGRRVRTHLGEIDLIAKARAGSSVLSR